MAGFGGAIVDIDALLADELLETRAAKLAEAAAEITVQAAELDVMADAKAQMLADPFIAFVGKNLFVETLSAEILRALRLDQFFTHGLLLRLGRIRRGGRGRLLGGFVRRGWDGRGLFGGLCFGLRC